MCRVRVSVSTLVSLNDALEVLRTLSEFTKTQRGSRARQIIVDRCISLKNQQDCTGPLTLQSAFRLSSTQCELFVLLRLFLFYRSWRNLTKIF